MSESRRARAAFDLALGVSAESEGAGDQPATAIRAVTTMADMPTVV
jgi:hypothetical protein